LVDILNREYLPTLEEAAILLRLLATVDLVQTANLMLSRVSYWVNVTGETEWSYGDERLAKLYVPLLGTCLRTGQVELASRLLASAKENGIHEEVGVKAIAGLIKLVFDTAPPENPQRRSLVDTELSEGISITSDSKGSNTLFVARWVKNLVEKEKWRPDPALLSWLSQKAVREPGVVSMERRSHSKHNPSGFTATKRNPNFVPFSLNDNNRRAALVFMSLSARYLGYVDMQVARVILATIQNKAFQYENRSSPPKGRLIDAGLHNEVDEVARNLRWAPYIYYNDGFMLEDQAESVPVPPNGEASIEPNRLPAIVYCRLITTYLRVGDIHGAASVMAWARDEAQLTFAQIEAAWDNRKYSFKDFLTKSAFAQKRKHKRHGSEAGSDPVDVLQLLAGAVPVPRSKPWWERPPKHSR
jgi:hypothetical protein